MKSSMLLSMKIVLKLLVLGYLWIATCRDISKHDKEIEKQLEILNKPSEKTFKTTEGETIDCVNIYTQPALDHPLLKNHKIQMSPTFLARLPNSSQNTKWAFHRLREPCPDGTVPIVRVDKHDLITAQSIPKELSSSNAQAKNTEELHLMFVSIRTQKIPKYGGGGRTSVYNLTVNDDQFSSVQLWIESSFSHPESMITAGWRVFPQLNGDGLTRLFTYWTGNRRNGCYNTLCPGYVQVNKVVTPDFPLIQTSIRGKASMELHFQIRQDRKTGNWWFVIGRSPKQFGIGYWPKELFVRLKDGCDAVTYGGMAMAGRDGKLPPLGSGYFPDGNYYNSCYFADLHYIDSHNKTAFPPARYTGTHTDKCYGFKYFSYTHLSPYHYNLQLGGPGGLCSV